MAMERVPRERIKWATASEKPAVMQGWSSTLARDVRAGLPSYRLGLVLPALFHSTKGICWMKRDRLAAVSGVSVSSVRDGLRELEDLGHVGRDHVVMGGKRVRVIFPTVCHEVDGQARRARKGGVAKGVDPADIAAEKARAAPPADPADSEPKDVDGGAEPIILPAEMVEPQPPAVPETDPLPGSWDDLLAVVTDLQPPEPPAVPPASAGHVVDDSPEPKRPTSEIVATEAEPDQPAPARQRVIGPQFTAAGQQLCQRLSLLNIARSREPMTADEIEAAQIAWHGGHFVAWAVQHYGRRALLPSWTKEFDNQRGPIPDRT